MAWKKKSEKTPEESEENVEDMNELRQKVEKLTEQLTEANKTEAKPKTEQKGYIVGEVATQTGLAIIGPDGKQVDSLTALCRILNILEEK